MKFEKINNNKLKITLTKLELPENSELDSLMKNSSNARESFMKILKIFLIRIPGSGSIWLRPRPKEPIQRFITNQTAT